MSFHSLGHRGVSLAFFVLIAAAGAAGCGGGSSPGAADGGGGKDAGGSGGSGGKGGSGGAGSGGATGTGGGAAGADGGGADAQGTDGAGSDVVVDAQPADADGGGSGGSPDAPGTDADGGASDASDAGDTGGAACGNVGQACCAAGNACGSNLLCLGGASCSCAKALLGRYLLRSDGTLLYEADAVSATNQTPVLDASTALPLTGVVDAMEGYTHGCAVLGGDHTAWCWRSSAEGNSNGELGSGVIDTTGPLFRANKVLKAANQPLTDVVGISAADRATSDGTCAVTSDGKVYCWGNDTWLTNGGLALKSAYAIQITTDGLTPFTGALQVAVNGTHACALVQGASSKEVWCWGNNGHGQLGTGDGTYQRYPKKVLGLTNPTKVIAYGSEGYWGRTCALDGSNVRCWGANGGGYYELGTTSPTLVTLAGGATALGMVVDIQGAAQDNVRVNTCARTSNNTVLCWGTAFGNDPVAYGVTNVVSLGSLAGGSVRVLTSDGLYHINATTRTPNCGPL